MNQYEDLPIPSGNNNNTFSIKFLEIFFIFAIIFSVICKVTNHDLIHSTELLNKIYTFVITKLGIEEKGLISYIDEISMFGLETNQVNIVVASNLNTMRDFKNPLPSNHISNISPTNNFPMSTPNFKLDEEGNIIPNDTFLKSNPFLIPNNANKKMEVKENPNQYPTIIVTLPNEVILPYSPKIPMDIYYREGWVDYANPNPDPHKNPYHPKAMQKEKTYDFNYLAPLIPKNHPSLKLQQSFLRKRVLAQEQKATDEDEITPVQPETTEKSMADTASTTTTTTTSPKTVASPSTSDPRPPKDLEVFGGFYVNHQVSEYVEDYELVNHAFWWQEDPCTSSNCQAIAV